MKYICFLMDEEGDVENDKEVVINIYVPNLYKKWYTTGIESLTEDERFLLTLVEPDIKKAKELGKDNEIMEEYIHEAIEVSRDDDLLEAYDKEWALKDQGYHEGKEEKKAEIVKNMIKENIGINLIMKVTGLTKEEVETYGNVEFKNDDLEAYDKKWALKDQGYREGKEEGIETGKKEKEIEIVKNMLKEKADINFIMKITGLSKKKIESYLSN